MITLRPNNISHLFFSPYTRIIFSGKQLHLHQSVTGTSLSLCCTQEWARKLISLLQTGVDKDLLLQFMAQQFPSQDTDRMLGLLLERGMIE